jgi:hypothetical protein
MPSAKEIVEQAESLLPGDDVLARARERFRQ